MKKLVFLENLQPLSIKCWPSLGHYIGVLGLVEGTEVDETTGDVVHKVHFDRSPSLSEEHTEWFCMDSEVVHYHFIVGQKVLFRANEDDIPLMAKIERVEDTEDGLKKYDFTTIGGLQFFDMPEMFLRPFPANY